MKLPSVKHFGDAGIEVWVVPLGMFRARREDMPPPEIVLAQLTAIAEQAFPLAIAWHLVLAAAFVVVPRHPRVFARVPAFAIVALAASVCMVAAWFGNPFNALVFALLAAALAVIAVRTPFQPLEMSDRARCVAGAAMMIFGWAYPHFLDDKSPAAYLVGAPLGLLPCPTLAFAIGVSLLLDRGWAPRVWSIVLGAAGLFYGVFGAVKLGVHLDLALVFGAAFLLAEVARGSLRALGRAAAQHPHMFIMPCIIWWSSSM